MRARIDFETRSLIDLKKAGAFKYAADPSTSIMCMAWQLPLEEVKIWDPSQGLKPLDPLFKWVKSISLVEAHNAEFEFLIWNYVGSRLGFPEIIPYQLRCSAAQAAVQALPRSLEDVGKALSLPVQKDMHGRRVMLKLSKPRKETKNDFSIWHESSEDRETLFEYCKKDVITEELVSERLKPLSKRNQKLWELTLKINSKGIFFDKKSVLIAIDFLKNFEDETLFELFNETRGQITGAKQVAKIMAWFKSEGVEIPNLQAGTITEKLKEENIPECAKRVLQIRQMLSLSSISKLKRMLEMGMEDDRIRGTILFNAASTGRYGGRGIQPQNFLRPKIKDVNTIFDALAFEDYKFFKTVYGNVFESVASTLRGMLCAPPAKELFAGDFNAIEARVLLWLAGAEENLEVYRQGKDPYVEMAAAVFNVNSSQIKPEQRQVGKAIILACGFGMGVDKFKITCESNGLKITEGFSKWSVQTFREKYWAVKNFWHDIENVAMRAVKFKGRIFELRHLKFICEDDFLQVVLPSRRRLYYYKPGVKVEMTKFGPKEQLSFLGVHAKTKQLWKETTYGGKLAENITQAVAYDLMAEAMMRLDARGFNIIMTVHDEIVTEENKGVRELEEFISIMSESPPWAQDCPIKVEGWKGPRYRK